MKFTVQNALPRHRCTTDALWNFTLTSHLNGWYTRLSLVHKRKGGQGLRKEV
jgi:hypothetical protein